MPLRSTPPPIPTSDTCRSASDDISYLPAKYKPLL
jgi:hypothetical protein